MSTQPNPAETAATVIAREGRRVRVLTWATVLLWVVAAVGTVLLLIFFKVYVISNVWIMSDVDRNLSQQKARTGTLDPKDLQLLWGASSRLAVGATLGVAALTAMVGVLALACLGTVLLVFATRRATLRQIQVSLADISAQLAALRQGLPSAPPGGGMRTGEGSR
jgi:hypothetical protein